MLVITKAELVKLGYGDWQAADIIRKSKAHMVSQGYVYYKNKRLGIVPISAVESVLGINLEEMGKEVVHA